MSAIGEYVHLYASNYLEYGINRFGTTPNLNAYDAMKTQRQRTRDIINQKLTVSNKENIEMGLNNIFSKRKSSSAQGIEEKIIQAINDKIQKKVQRMSFSSVDNFTQIAKSSSLINTKGKNIRLTTLLNKINDIEQQVKNLSKQKAPKAQELKKAIENIYHSFANAVSKEAFSKEELELIKTNNIEKIQQMIGQKSFFTQEIEGLTSMINTTLQTFNVPSATAVEFITDTNKIISASKKKIFEAIEKELGTYWDIKNFIDVVDLQTINQYYNDGHTTAETKLNGDSFIMNLHWNEIALKTGMELGGHDFINSQYILQSNLMNILQGLNNTDLINHWLNLQVSHPSIKKTWSLKERKTIKEIEPRLTTAHYKGLEEILYHAISTEIITQQLQEESVFVVKDGNYYKIYDLGDLLDKTTLPQQLVTDFYFANQRAVTIKKRLSRLTKALHQSKVMLTIKPDVMQQGFYN